MPAPNLFRIILLNTLLVVESSMIPLQLLQFPRSPFFGSLKRSPVCQSSGNLSSSQIVLKIAAKTHEISGSPAFYIIFLCFRETFTLYFYGSWVIFTLFTLFS